MKFVGLKFELQTGYSLRNNCAFLAKTVNPNKKKENSKL
jgi:hypothetical protein